MFPYSNSGVCAARNRACLIEVLDSSRFALLEQGGQRGTELGEAGLVAKVGYARCAAAAWPLARSVVRSRTVRERAERARGLCCGEQRGPRSGQQLVGTLLGIIYSRALRAVNMCLNLLKYSRLQ